MTHSIHTAVFRVAALLMLLFTPSALSQNANDILDASRQALAEVAGFDAQFKLEGDGGSMFSDTMPAMNGKLFFGTHEELGRVIHAIGESKDKRTDPSAPVDMLLAQDRAVWTDMSKQTINEVPRSGNTRGNPTALTLVLIDTIINTDPFSQDANNAQSITLGTQEEVGGVMCDQIVIKRAESVKASKDPNNKYTDVIWWIAQGDKLPRRVDRITDAGLVKINLSFSLSGLKIRPPTSAQLDVARPEGFQLISRLPSPEAETQPTTTTNKPTQPSINEVPAPRPTPTLEPKAPDYSFVTSDGSTISNARQQGKVSVLYFWGSWCVPCTTTSPLIDAMALELADPSLDVFALAIREGNPQQALSAFQEDYPTPRVSVNPEGISSDFKIRVFPSVVVIDQDGYIIFQRGIGRNYSAEQLIEDTRKAVSEALNAA
jgi:thiol-disulfide isomerase/thioredoxin